MSFLLEIFRLGLNNLRLHMLRSTLTSLGIILGVAAVIIMVSIGEGNKQAALREIQALGATNIIVRSTKPPESASVGSEQRSFIASYGIERLDLRRLQESIDDALDVVAIKAIGSEVQAGAQRIVSQSFGVTPELKRAAAIRLARGRYITPEDIEGRLPVAVIGDGVAKKLFPLQDPIGKDLRIDTVVFRVVGILEPVGLAGGKGSKLVGRDLNLDVHVPMATAEQQFGDVVYRRESGSFSGNEVQLAEIYVTASGTDAVINTAQRVRRIMEVNHNGLLDIDIIVPWELLENAKRTALVWNVVLISIAAISLVVGGIGIMNIMLASVTERTREIGIRRALGATRSHIVAQFLVETGALSAVGGLVGIGLGVGVSVGIEQLLPAILEWGPVRRSFNADFTLETQVTMWSIVASFCVAAFVGLSFGIYPAIVASRKDPVAALRHD